MEMPPSWSPGLCTKKLATATTAARASTMFAMNRIPGRACDIRSVNQTVASWTVRTIEVAHSSVTETETM